MSRMATNEYIGAKRRAYAHAHASRNACTQIKNLLYHLCLVA